MHSTLEQMRERIAELEQELSRELAAKQQEFQYTVEKKKIQFSRDVEDAHRKLAKRWTDYAYESGWLMILTIPIIWFALLPAFVLDLFLVVYQAICFPIYGIPKVRRRDYVILDRQKLRYLNWLEKANCMYCGYFNGLMGYVREVAGRTEQYWCPIRHAHLPKSTHSRYDHFVDFGDAAGYRQKLDEIRKDFGDVKK